MKRTFLILILFMIACTKEKQQITDNSYIGKYTYYSIYNKINNSEILVNASNRIEITADTIRIDRSKYSYKVVNNSNLETLIIPDYTNNIAGIYTYSNNNLVLNTRDYIHKYIKE